MAAAGATVATVAEARALSSLCSPTVCSRLPRASLASFHCSSSSPSSSSLGRSSTHCVGLRVARASERRSSNWSSEVPSRCHPRYIMLVNRAGTCINLGQWTASSLEDSLSSRNSSLVLPKSPSPLRPWGGRVVVARMAGRRASGIVFAAAAPAGTEELPAKLQEIVRLFQQVADPRAKYEQLLYYAKQLKPLAKEFCTKENKVEGCVSQVWVRPSLNVEEGTVSFEAESDSLLTKGLAALLVEGLSGATVKEVLKVNPDFVQMLGLKQSLTPSRSNGFLNMLKLMQKKTLQMFMEAEAGKASSVAKVRENDMEVKASASQLNGVESRADSGEQNNGANSSASAAPEQRSMKSSIEKKLQEALSPTVLVVDDVSHQHAGHAGVHKGATETHFNVTVVSDKFTGSSLIKRHRLIYGLLDEELKNGVHALSLVTKTPSEPVS